MDSVIGVGVGGERGDAEGDVRGGEAVGEEGKEGVEAGRQGVDPVTPKTTRFFLLPTRSQILPRRKWKAPKALPT